VGVSVIPEPAFWDDRIWHARRALRPPEDGRKYGTNILGTHEARQPRGTRCAGTPSELGS
jgi:hypothetical protein